MGLVYDSAAIAEAVQKVAREIADRHVDTAEIGVVGIANGGVVFGQRLARELASQLGSDVPYGTLNAQFHRDDIAHKPIPKAFMRTDIPFDIDDSVVILADDVLFSGRTVRAALNELFDHGRPVRVEFAVLVDRGGRSLPVAADYTGLRVNAAPDQQVVVRLDGESPGNDRVSVEQAR